jgi:hypothetical protein
LTDDPESEAEPGVTCRRRTFPLTEALEHVRQEVRTDALPVSATVTSTWSCEDSTDARTCPP